MQDINKRQREREWAIAQTQGIFFEVRAPLLYIPAFDTRRISTIIDPTDHSVSQHLQLSDSLVRTHRKLSSSPRPHLKHGVHTRTRNNANALVRLLKVQRRSLWWSQHFDHLKTISLQHSYKMNNQWVAQVFLWENKERDGGGKLKENLF